MGEYKVIQGDCLETLKKVRGNSIQCCITSPPYYGLRDYGTAKWEGGDENCSHTYQKGGRNPETSSKQLTNKGTTFSQYEHECKKCGAIRVDKQIGLEQTPEEYVNKLVEIFREVRRVLKDDGTLWLNIGDSYVSNPSTKINLVDTFDNNFRCDERNTLNKTYQGAMTKKIKGLKPKDLIGIPWMVAFALRADGWFLRQDIIWCLSGGTWLYVRTQKGDMPMMIKDIARLSPDTVKLWNGEKWVQLLGMNKSKRTGNEIEIVLRSGERISCTPNHQFPTNKGLKKAQELNIRDIIDSCHLPEPENVRDCHIDEDAAWFVGLYIAEGSMSGDTIQIAGHIKEEERWERVQKIVHKFGGSATRTCKDNKMNIRIYGKLLVALLSELVSGRTAIDKCFSPIVWRYSNNFLESMLAGYLSGDGHWDEKNNRWRLGFCRNYNLERDLRIVCARLGFELKLKPSKVFYGGKNVAIFKGEIRKSRSGHFNQKSMYEIVKIKKANCRYVWDLGVESEPHLFSLASGVLTHNSKNNPMPESIKDRCTKSHEYIFLLSKSQKYYFDYKAIQEPASSKKPEKEPSRGEGYVKAKGIRNNPDRDGGFSNDGYRNKRSVWFINTKPYKGAHFATFPTELIRPCIKAGSKEGDIILDPFAGSGTTGQVALEEGRNTLLIELNEEYIDLIYKRLNK